MEAALAMSHSRAVKAERFHTRPFPEDELREGSLGLVVELKWPSREYTASALDAEIPPPLLATESLLLRLLDRLQVWLRRAEQRRQLRTLSDSMLKDIGVSRADVEYETSRRFWQG
jgi:uncharacterized protein YjiS (DUF1127 family)